MTQEEKQLLLKDLCTRLPYGVKATTTSNGWKDVYIVSGYNNDRIYLDCQIYDEGDDEWLIESVKPYLRSMSNLTDEEKDEFDSLWNDGFGEALDAQLNGQNDLSVKTLEITASYKSIQWLLEHHFDFMGLIPKGLALEAPEGMYN